MVSTFTPNIQLEEPARGDQVGVWDTPVNSNMTVLDLVSGGNATISVAAGSVVLAAAQYQARRLTLSSTLIASVTITFPTSFTKSYDIFNSATGSSAFIITLQTTAAGGQVICAPPGECVEVFNTGTGLRYKTLDRVGAYWDYAGSSVPAWVAGCTVPPYLNCDGSTFSATTYPALAAILGSTTLPDCKGRTRYTLDQGAGRISSAATVGFSGSSVGASGGAQSQTLITANLPAYTPAGSVAGQINGSEVGAGAFHNQFAYGNGSIDALSYTGTFTGTAQGGTSTPFSRLPPVVIGGLTLIRSA